MTINAPSFSMRVGAGGVLEHLLSLWAPAWTVLTPSADSRLVYYSTAGDDGTGTNYTPLTIPAGTWDNPIGISPYRSPAAAKAQLRDGYPDYLLGKRGDTWTDENIGTLNVSGRSPSEPLVVSTYGSGIRPIFKVAGSSFAIINGDYITMTSLDAYSYTNDPDNAGYTFKTNKGGALVTVAANYFTLEDCCVRYNYGNGISGGNGNNIKFRFNTIHHNYGKWDGSNQANRAQGLFSANTGTGNIIEGNVAYHNGHLEYVEGAYRIFNTGPCWYSHNIYGGDPATVDIFGNLTAYSSFYGVKHVGDGSIYDNLGLHCPVALNKGGNSGPGEIGDAYNNTVLDGISLYNEDYSSNGSRDPKARGIYMDVQAGGECTYYSNIVANINLSATGADPYQEAGPGTMIDGGGNIIHHWAVGGGTGNDTGVPADYVDPERTLAGYSTLIGGAGTEEDFYEKLLANHKDNWDPNYYVANIKAYIDAGFAAP